MEQILIDHCYNIDCKDLMQAMIEQGIKADWCITDVPYAIGKAAICGRKGACEPRDYGNFEWDNKRLENRYFENIFKCSNQQLIFGGNYYTDILAPTKHWAIWDKRLPDKRDRNDFNDCEMAWCSTGGGRVFNYLFNGMLQGNPTNKDYRFHPTQKPTQLWYMLLNYYTKEGDLILDPFAGSQSLRIACHKLKRHYIGAELDKEYYDKGCEWFAKETAQMSIFDLMG